MTGTTVIGTRGRTAEGVVSDAIKGKHDEIKRKNATILYSDLYIKN